jgi:hypothetical protein
LKGSGWISGLGWESTAPDHPPLQFRHVKIVMQRQEGWGVDFIFNLVAYISLKSHSNVTVAFL